MTPIESSDEAAWDVFHEWVDEWARKNKLDPNQARRLIESSPKMLEALQIAKAQMKIELGDRMNDRVREDRLAQVEMAIEGAEPK